MPDERTLNATKIRLVKDDITLFPAEAMVFYARPDLALGSGYGNAIAMRGGPAVQADLKKLGSAKVGEAVVTGGGSLKAKYIIHAVGPRFQEEQLEKKLREVTLAALRRADEKGVKTVVLPPMGTGFYGVPLEVSAKVTLGAIQEHVAGKTGLAEVTVCMRDPRELKPFQTVLQGLNPIPAAKGASR